MREEWYNIKRGNFYFGKSGNFYFGLTPFLLCVIRRYIKTNFIQIIFFTSKIIGYYFNDIFKGFRNSENIQRMINFVNIGAKKSQVENEWKKI
jgi:hypothetical protein